MVPAVSSNMTSGYLNFLKVGTTFVGNGILLCVIVVALVLFGIYRLWSVPYYEWCKQRRADPFTGLIFPGAIVCGVAFLAMTFKANLIMNSNLSFAIDMAAMHWS